MAAAAAAVAERRGLMMIWPAARPLLATPIGASPIYYDGARSQQGLDIGVVVAVVLA